ncbi:hypothetical protein CDD80_5353 [Ophiocordyceps camponoti-rufipedis]|uniref:RING-type E3 ubiquitin transferase n=1 Tax=Ophiocordyceps camponoti-rufipedis TaxID=2004952 RepID=A0A2C5YWB3_9HYPO|nr:hypothetical protein CDD80_5353 [Ophiocordyceps camponoti-rufipedis]
MATPPRPSGPILAGSSEALDAQNDSNSSASSGSSPAAPQPCPWRTRRHHDDECSRYFDCPTHTIERDSGDAEASGQADSQPGSMPSLNSVGSAGESRMPDAEVTYCPICNAQFSIFVRKHHCRKCGRVVCNSCSPHRIIIPHQYIVRAPGSDVSISTSLLFDGLGAGYFEAGGQSGGERVRLCNPCVPDPNTAPPQSPASTTGPPPPSRHRPPNTVYGVGSGYGAVFTAGRSGDAYQYYSPRWRSVTMVRCPMSDRDLDGPVVLRCRCQGPTPHGGSAGHHGRIGPPYHAPFDRLLTSGLSGAAPPPRRHRHSSFGDATSSRHRALPPPPQIAEEDECPICHRELPSRGLPDFETLRESHISACIQAHSAYGSPRGDATALPPAPRRTGMYTYAATEKDCIDDAECTICLEEFAVGVAMARLECLCRFHKACISAWFVNHPGRCPVHQHDGFGF